MCPPRVLLKSRFLALSWDMGFFGLLSSGITPSPPRHRGVAVKQKGMVSEGFVFDGGSGSLSTGGSSI